MRDKFTSSLTFHIKLRLDAFICFHS